MDPVTCTNAHNDVIELVNHGMAENTKADLSTHSGFTEKTTKN